MRGHAQPAPTRQFSCETGLANHMCHNNNRTNMGIGVLPHITNALMLTSIFSAGNTYTYAATRSLYGLALQGHAPKFLRKTMSNGVPLYAFLFVMLFPFLSFLQLSNGSNKVLTWLVNLITAGGLINYIIMTITYICFYRACVAQGVDRTQFPYYARFQPYCAYIALSAELLVVFFYGYSSFTPWSVSNFFIYYAMLILAPVFYLGWKALKRTRFVRPHEADLVWERPVVEAYEASFVNAPIGFWTEMAQLVGFRRNIKEEQKFD